MYCRALVIRWYGMRQFYCRMLSIPLECGSKTAAPYHHPTEPALLIVNSSVPDSDHLATGLTGASAAAFAGALTVAGSRTATFHSAPPTMAASA